MVGCGANKSTVDSFPDGSPRPQADGGAAAPDTTLAKDAALAKDTPVSVTPVPDAAQVHSDLAAPDTSSAPKDSAREAAPVPTDTTADTTPLGPDTATHGDALPVGDTQLPDGQVKTSDGGTACNPSGTPATMVHLTAQELKAILDSTEKPYLINVKGSTIANIPGTDAVLASDVPGIEALVKKDLCADIIIYCRSGVTSQSVGTQLIAKGYQRVRDLKDGIGAWTAAGYPTE
jgi:rhodanese-related sulfurtransferase